MGKVVVWIGLDYKQFCWFIAGMNQLCMPPQSSWSEKLDR